MQVYLSNTLKKAIQLCLTFGIAVFIQTQVLAAPPALTPFSLKPLNSYKSNVVINHEHLATVAMIYQPDCSWCKKQGRALAKAFELCQHSVNIALVGTKGNVRQLKKELRHYHENMPAFIADRQFLRQIGGYQASPTTLIFNSDGQLISKKRGFIPQEKLAKALSIISQGACHI